MGTGRIRTVLTGLLTVVVLAFVGGAIVVGRGHPSAALDLGSGNAWFPTLRQGSVALIDGSTGSRVTRVDGVAAPNGNFDVEQSGSSALVVDRDKGTVTKVDAATWTQGAPLSVGSPGDQRLAVHTGAKAAWAVTQAGTVVQQLDPESMTTLGAPQTLPSEVSGIAVDDGGRLWVTSRSAELRSYRNGEQVTSTPLTGLNQTKLVLVDDKPVVVDPTTGRAVLIDADRGTVDHQVCLDVPTSPAPAVAGSTSDAPWLLAVGPNAGTLVVSDVRSGKCQAIPLGPTATSPRYGEPVEKDHFVYVPDFVEGRVIVIDPAQPPGRQILTHISLQLENAEFALLVHHRHVWFNEVKGDDAGVITDDFRAWHSSKAGSGSSSGRSTETPNDPAKDPTGSGSGGGGDGPVGGGTGGGGGTGTGSPTATVPTRVTPPGPHVPPPDPDDPALLPGLPTPRVATVTPEFTMSPNPAVVGEDVTFTDTTTGEGNHSVAGWTLSGGTPATSTKPHFTATFAKPGTYDITLTVDTPTGAKPVTHKLIVDTMPKVPTLAGMTVPAATAKLTGVGLVLGKTTAVASIIPTGLVVDSQPNAGTSVKTGSTVDVRNSTGVGMISTVAGPAPGAGNLNHPARLASDGAGNVYIADWGNNQVKMLAPSGVVTVIAGTGQAGFSGENGPATLATLHGPIAVTLDAAGNIYVADELNYRVRKIDGKTHKISTVAGDGTRPPRNGALYAKAVAGDPLATNIWPIDLDVTPAGDLYISARWQAQILRLTPAGQLAPVAQPAAGVQLSDPASIEFDVGGTMYVAEPHANHILRFDGTKYEVIIGTGVGAFNGDGRLGTDTQVHDPDSIRFDGFGNLYFPDWSNERLRRWSSTTRKVDTVAGNGVAGFDGDRGSATEAQLRFADPCCSSGLVFDSQGSLLFSDLANDRVRKVGVTPP